MTIRINIVTTIITFWSHKHTWKRAAKNTLNCLVGCSLGDFSMLIYLQVYHPNISLTLNMILPMIAGLISSITLETIILKIKEKFYWVQAFRTAFSMSFISMLAMEFSENATDFLLTGRTVPITDWWYWGALGIALIAGFLVPLPYNYYKIKRYGNACH
jgi:hypothetical protein